MDISSGICSIYSALFISILYSALFISILYTFYNYYNGLFAGNGSVGSVGRSVNRIKKATGVRWLRRKDDMIILYRDRVYSSRNLRVSIPDV